MDQLELEIREQGYCHLDHQNHEKLFQKSVFRTNCMDCLDRTNVVQTVFARRTLSNILFELGITGSLTAVENIPELEENFRHSWANNADTMANQYAGSGAMKTDFTRTGKRSTTGILADGYNALLRYGKNNFFDGWRQDGFDLFLGNYEVNTHSSSPFDRPFTIRFILVGVYLISNSQILLLIPQLPFFTLLSLLMAMATAMWDP
ncbi:Phosphatidylinositide phosphatase SAC1, partial [Nowakowskiella sp. JEL0078]